jgi:N6-adenosine-specific RNA methylase IME4
MARDGGGKLRKASDYFVGKLPLLDERPIEIGGFRLSSRSAVAIGRPSLEEFGHALRLAEAFAESAPYWIGDLMRYADNREDWREKLEQVISATGYARQTIMNYTSLCNRVAEPERAIAPSVGHANEVAPLPRVDQARLLEKATVEGWNVRDLRNNIRIERRRKVIEGQAVLEGMFRVIYADPPWLYGNSGPGGCNPQNHYPGMTIEDLCKLPVQAHAMPNSVLWLWVPAPMLLENPGPREVIEAWGFTPKTGRVWDKVLHGFGHYVDVRHEHLIIATRGSCTPDRLTPMLESVVVERRSDVHSQKPDSFRADIVRLYDGPYLELFGRERVEGWSVFGNDARLWGDQAAKGVA